MTTEHFTLQTARAASTAESNGRSALFIGAVSSAVVALAFIGQVSGMGEGFFLFGLVLFPSLLFLGFVTFMRLIQTGIEDLAHGFGIKRIRHYYIELAPEIRPYLIHSIQDDAFDALESIGIVPLKWQMFLTNSGTVAVINGVIAGVFAGMLVRFRSSLPIYVDMGVGIVLFIVSVYAQYRYQSSKWKTAERRLEALFLSAAK
jgi:hypothetical protein